MVDEELRMLLIEYAGRYENSQFISGDPSWFMHQVKGVENQEVTAFIASALSYGSRKQFMPKIDSLLISADNDLYQWILRGTFKSEFSENDKKCFYRLYNIGQMSLFFSALQSLLIEYNSIGNFLRARCSDGLSAVKLLCDFFAERNSGAVIPKDATSACKRICMFLRWMVRDNSPVDLGLWADFIDKRTLIMPLDTHVVTEASKLNLITSKAPSMRLALQLTKTVAEIFPEDPLRADFAMFGYGVNNS